MLRTTATLLASAVNYGLGMAVVVFLLQAVTEGALPVLAAMAIALFGAGLYALLTATVAERLALQPDGWPRLRQAARPSVRISAPVPPPPVSHRVARGRALAPVPVRVDSRHRRSS